MLPLPLIPPELRGYDPHCWLWPPTNRRPKASASLSVVHLSITSPAITTAATVIPGTDINITIDEFTIVHPTIVDTITAAVTVDIIDTIIGTIVIDKGFKDKPG